MSKANNHSLPFANAATIVRANQKDTYFESIFRNHISETLSIFKGQKFINFYPEEITIGSKVLYLALTTLLGYRTLGEEYVDLIYVDRRGKRFPRLFNRLLFIASYALLPYIINKIVKKFKKNEEDQDNKWMKFFTSYSSVLDTLMNLHIAIFYFQGNFYSLSKRIFGMRYVFGHNKDPNKISQSANYSLLGGIILVQFLVKFLIKFKAYTDKTNLEESIIESDKIYNINQLTKPQESIELSDPNQLPYIPENSRNCILCLSPMTDPTSANCGHLFCWECIVDWVRENPECPLCRTACLEQNLLPLR